MGDHAPRDRAGSTTTVTVIEGVVRVATTQDAPVKPTITTAPSPRVVGVTSTTLVQEEAQLAAGEQASIERGAVSKLAKPDPNAAVAWRERVLVFRDAPLTEVAREFNRYNASKIQIEDAEIGARLMNGTYSVDRPQILTRYLEMDRSVTVSHERNIWIVRRR